MDAKRNAPDDGALVAQRAKPARAALAGGTNDLDHISAKQRTQIIVTPCARFAGYGNNHNCDNCWTFDPTT